MIFEQTLRWLKRGKSSVIYKRFKLSVRFSISWYHQTAMVMRFKTMARLRASQKMPKKVKWTTTPAPCEDYTLGNDALFSVAWHCWLFSLLFIYLTLAPKIIRRLFPVCNFLLSWHIASVWKTFQSGGMRKEHLKDALRSKAILAQIFCLLHHKRCCLAFILLGFVFSSWNDCNCTCTNCQHPQILGQWYQSDSMFLFVASFKKKKLLQSSQ